MPAPTDETVSAKPRARQRASDTPDPFFATTLARGLQLLGAFRVGDRWLTIKDLAERSGLTRPTVWRLVNTLVRVGYLKKNEERRYRLSPQVLGIVFPLLVNYPIRWLARPLMREFAEQVGCAVSMGVVEGPNLIYIESVRSGHQLPNLPEVGFSCPLYSTAIGRAAMSLMTDSELAAVHQVVEREQPDLFGSKRQNADAGIADCRAQGYCVQYGEWRREILGAGAPLLRTADGECISINCGIPAYRTTPQQLRDEYGPRILELARAIRVVIQQGDANASFAVSSR